jgi:hypothetical protein
MLTVKWPKKRSCCVTYAIDLTRFDDTKQQEIMMKFTVPNNITFWVSIIISTVQRQGQPHLFISFDSCLLLMVISPLLKVARPVRTSRREVLPEPLGPYIIREQSALIDKINAATCHDAENFAGIRSARYVLKDRFRGTSSRDIRGQETTFRFLDDDFLGDP